MRAVSPKIEKITLKSPTLNFLSPENFPDNTGKVSAFPGSSTSILSKIFLTYSLSIYFFEIT